MILIWIGLMLLGYIRLKSRGNIKGKKLFKLCRLIILFISNIRVLCLLLRARLNILN